MVWAQRKNYLGNSRVVKGGPGDIGGVNYSPTPRQQKTSSRGRGNNSRLDPVSAKRPDPEGDAAREAARESITLKQERRSEGETLAGLYPWMSPVMVDAFVNAYADTGSAALAENEVRNGKTKREYDQVFPGNRREDGTLRYDENRYASVRNTFQKIWSRRGLDATLLSPTRIGELIGGEVSPEEFEGRVSAVEEQVVLNLPEVLRAFTEQLGVAATKEAALASLLDPSINEALLNRQISVSQIRGEASRFGFTRSFDRGDRLAAAGVNQGQARQFFSGAATALPSLDLAATRFGEMDESVDLEEFEEAALLDDPFQRQRIQRLQRRQQSEFSQSAGVLGAGGGALAGLDEV